MTTESRGDRATASAGAAFGASGRALVRLARYLGPLLLDVCAYAWRLSLDTVLGVRVLTLRYRARKAPERAAELRQIEKQYRDSKTARWTPWRALPIRRRFAIRAAAVAVLIAVLAGARARDETSAQLEIQEAPTAALASADVTAPARTAVVDLDAAATRFQRARATGPGQWTFLTEGPVLTSGARGEFDDFTIASPWVLREADGGGTRYRMWYRGCYFRGRDRGCGIGHATSADGVRWQKTKGPVFEPSDPVGSRGLSGVTVVRSGGRYFLWYSVTPELFGPRLPSTLHLATSADGLRWEAAGQVLAATSRDPEAIEPSALHDGTRFHLWFSDNLRTFASDDFALQPGAPFLMHFTSPDGRTWQESGRFPVSQTGLDNFRAVVESRREGGFQAMGLEGRQYVRFVSKDGNDWVRDSDATTPINASSLSPDVWYVTDATAMESDGGALVWFVTQRQSGREEIRVAFRKGS